MRRRCGSSAFPPAAKHAQIVPTSIPAAHVPPSTKPSTMTVKTPVPIVLASGSEVRANLLRNAGLTPEIRPAHVDEDALRAALLAEGARAREIADALAEVKSRKGSDKAPEALVIGCDQVLECEGEILSKATDKAEARAQLAKLEDRTHRLYSAAVICQAGRPLWRHVGTARMTMRRLSDAYRDDYVERNWNSIRHSVGCYKLEEEGVRLFRGIEGDYFTVLGLPLIELLTWLAIRGDIAS